MKRQHLTLTKTILILITSLCFTPQAQAEKQTRTHTPFTLERVIDGDTIIADGRKIRLWGIDAPEAKTLYGPIATIFLESLLKDGELNCKFIEKDKYSRDVMHCLIDNSDVGSMMVQAGMAQDYSRYSKDYYQHEEDIAKKEHRGIWDVEARNNTIVKSPPKSCCKYCTKGKPCGNSCINRSYTCRKPAGCAC